MGELSTAGMQVSVDPARSSFDDVYRDELAAIVGLAALLVRSQAVAEELAQDAFLHLFERFDQVDNPAGFLRTVVVRLCLTWQQRRTTELRLMQKVGVDHPAGIPEVDETWQALGRLDPDRRTVLVLRYYEHLRHREIAELLGCPTSTVRSRTRRALKDLRKEIERVGARCHSTEELGMMPQLFGDPDSGKAIYVTSNQYEIAPTTAEDINVRGQAGRAGPSWNIEESDMGEAIEWAERGLTITALYKGVSEDTALDVLDSLAWRSDDPADGFAPPDDGEPMPLRAEVPGQRASHDVSLTYSDGPPVGFGDGTGSELTVHTSASTTAATWYLEGWYLEGSEAGGGERPTRHYNDEYPRLEMYWPDGRSVIVDGTDEALSRDTLERVADSLTGASEADLEGLRDSVDTRVAALPVVASAASSIGTLEVHGVSGFLQMCLRKQGESEPNCMTSLQSAFMLSDDVPAEVSGEWTVDGTWFVAVASKGRILG